MATVLAVDDTPSATIVLRLNGEVSPSERHPWCTPAGGVACRCDGSEEANCAQRTAGLLVAGAGERATAY
jgi:hypothetical protein